MIILVIFSVTDSGSLLFWTMFAARAATDTRYSEIRTKSGQLRRKRPYSSPSMDFVIISEELYPVG